jgi:hypothetical protein
MSTLFASSEACGTGFRVLSAADGLPGGRVALRSSLDTRSTAQLDNLSFSLKPGRLMSKARLNRMSFLRALKDQTGRVLELDECLRMF